MKQTVKFWFVLADLTVIAILVAEAVLAIVLLCYGVYTLAFGSVRVGLLCIAGAVVAGWLGLLSSRFLFRLSEGLLTLVTRRAERTEQSQTFLNQVSLAPSHVAVELTDPSAKAAPIESDLIAEVGVDQIRRLYVRPKERSFPYIYREAMEWS